MEGSASEPIGRRLALGTVQFGLPYGIANKDGQPSRADAAKIVSVARSGGIDTIDTATSYGDSEQCLGEIGMAGLRVVTKIPSVPAGVGEIGAWVDAEIGASLARLRVSRLDGVLLHRPMELLGAHGAELFKALRGLKERALTRKIGVSVYAPSELDALVPRFSFDLVQAPLSLVDRRLITSGWAQRLKERGTELHTRSAFLQGLLLLPREGVPSRFERWKAVWDRWHGWLKDAGAMPVSACLAFPLSQPEVDRVVVGTDNAGQMQQLLEGAAHRLDAPLPDIACDDEDLINPARWQTA